VRYSWGIVLLMVAVTACRSDQASVRRVPQDTSTKEKPASSPSEETLRQVVQISLSDEYSCALLQSGAIYCWGTPDEYGRYLEWRDARPARVQGIDNARSVAVDFRRAIAQEESGRVMSWGRGVAPRYRLISRSETRPTSLVFEPLDPELDPNDAQRRFPNDVRAHPGSGSPQERTTRRAMDTRMVTDDRIYVIRGGVCLYSAREELSCDFYHPEEIAYWNIGEAQKIPGLVAVVGQAEHELCTLSRDGLLRCWREEELAPGAIGPTGWFDLELPSAVQLVHGSSDYMALLADGRVADWSHRRFQPAIVDGVGSLKQVSLGSLVTPLPSGACGVRKSGAVLCWSPTFFDDGHRPPPHEIPGISDAVQVEVGGLHACALLADGRVQCWGHNQHGQCGIGEFSDEVKTPTFVVAPEGSG
jgi:hypothetical protein